MDEKEIKKAISIFKKNPFLSELEIEESGKKIRLKRDAAPAIAPLPAKVIEERQTPNPDPVLLKSDKKTNLQQVESPMVGTFYRAPSPNSKAFVEVGDTVLKGKVVCIIEAMKLMNEIESDVSGKVVEILPQNGKPVEFGEPLILLEPL